MPCQNSLVTRADFHKLVDELPDTAVEGAGVLLRGIIRGPIDPDQAWFWTPEWQAKEREADADIAAGRGVFFGSDEEFIAHLESPAGRVEIGGDARRAARVPPRLGTTRT